jgi:formamidopyrimidine-DNA glycosylase
MPELPDVEGFRRYMSRHAAGRRVKGVRVPAADVVRNTSAQGLARALKGRKLSVPRRHGKWLLAPTDGPILILHFGMTGGLHWTGSPDGEDRHDRVIFELDGGELRYRNMRKLGGVWLARDEEGVEGVIGNLGPDAAELSGDEFDELLRGRRGGIKATLMNQRLIAGIGNELSDEILWQARIRPSTRITRLSKRRRAVLYEAMDDVLRESMRRGRIPRHRSWLTSQRGQREPTCPRCGGRIKRTPVAGRTSYWCPRCQRP